MTPSFFLIITETLKGIAIVIGKSKTPDNEAKAELGMSWNKGQEKVMLKSSKKPAKLSMYISRASFA